MKTILKFITVIVCCFVTCIGCSKDSDITCGTVTDFNFRFISMFNGSYVFKLTVKLPDGSIRHDWIEADRIDSDAYKVGDEYCGDLLK
ncbi:hypothetical protein N1F78_09635 [Seonamhaeicola sp. MEBiC1930]|uniref:hypothetical protein n=1 Tax=Seonamhaeicola sp. MEBiC01930 TaxID=2976768 RepID=UPI003248932B